MANPQDHRIAIIGAGLAGCFLAILLAKRGYHVDIYERYSQNELCSNASKKSYNLVLYGFGMAVLKEAGVWEELEPLLIRIDGSVTEVSQNPKVSRVNKSDTPYFTAQRAELLNILINQAKRSKLITFYFQTELIAIDRYKKTMFIEEQNSKHYKTVKTDIIIGADGINSRVRGFLQQGQETHHKQEYLPWEYKQIHLTKAAVEKLQLKPHYTYAWTRKQAVFFGYANKDDSFSAMLVLPQEKKTGFSSLTNASAIEQFFKANFSSLLPVLPEITQAILESPSNNFVTIYTQPWYYKNFITLIGDAAHGFVPFSGQGMSTAFADGIEFTRLLDTYGPDWEAIFPKYQERLKRHTDVLAHVSKRSFSQYLRYKMADFPTIYNTLEIKLHKLFPQIFHPPTFSLIGDNPLGAADYEMKHAKQRRIARFLGVSLVVSVLTALIGIQETLSKNGLSE